MEDNVSNDNPYKIYEAKGEGCVYRIKKMLKSAGQGRKKSTLVLSKRAFPSNSEFNIRISTTQAASIIELTRFRGIILCEKFISEQLAVFRQSQN
jgi:hypothetical protein